MTGASHAKARNVIGRSSNANTTASRSASRGVPRDVNVVAKGAIKIRVGGDHRLVIEMTTPAFQAEKRHARISRAAVGRTRDRHFGSINSVAVPEEDDDVAVKYVAAGVERQCRIGAKIDSVTSLRRRQWKI